ncbi:MAG: protein phosphatase 2C domain-containing protein [Polyangiaceae bacterium]
MIRTSRLYVAEGSVPGREHVRLGANAQDAVGVVRHAGRVVAVVADGCGSSAGSEVGARLGVGLILATVGTWCVPESASESCERLRDVMLAGMRSWSAPFGADAFARVVEAWFLFTLQIAVVDVARTFLLGCGDGAYVVGGRTVVLDAGDANAPDYLAYGLFEDGRGRLEVREDSPHDVDGDGSDVAVAIATDGALPLARSGELAAMATDARYARNPSLLRKDLARFALRPGAFPDDVTVAVVGARR